MSEQRHFSSSPVTTSPCIGQGAASSTPASSTSESSGSSSPSDGGTATLPPPPPASTKTVTRPKTAPPKVDQLPQWRVLLHNDDVNDMAYVVTTIVELVRLNLRQAMLQMIEAHVKGLTLLVVTHRERAELLAEQFASKRLTVTIEPEN